MTLLFKSLAILFLTVILVTSLQAQNQVSISLKQPPPNKLGVSEMWNLELNNTTGSDIKIYLTGTATEERDGLIIEGKSKVFTLKPGRSNYKYNNFSNAEVKYNNSKYKEIILRTGNAPEGTYTICVTAYTEQGEIAGLENCIIQPVQEAGSITLLSPADGEEIDTEQPLIFTWTILPKAKDYTLKIVEIRTGQSPDAAMKENRELFMKDGIRTAVFKYPINEKKFEGGSKYAWQISTGESKSDVWEFSFKKSLPSGLISREEAIDLIIKKVLVPQTLDHKVTVFLGMQVTPSGSVVRSFKGEDEKKTLNKPTWFGWINDNPQAFFEHETRFVYIDAVTGNYEVTAEKWWPVVDGESLWMSEEEKDNPAVLIYSDIHLSN
ncbi:MAG: hypothetical protein L0Y77_04275 [Chlorobi bacterium]|nr:hypothetical protein [Chlorobiota bacterium]